MTYDDNLFSEQDDALKKDLYEQMIKDCAYDLYRQEKITKIDLAILLHSHGIDEFFPKKTAKEIGRLYNIKNTEVRTKRFNTAKKVAEMIRKKEKRKPIKKHLRLNRLEKRISIRISSVLYSTIQEFCQTKNRNIAEIWRSAISDWLAQNSEFATHEPVENPDFATHDT